MIRALRRTALALAAVLLAYLAAGLAGGLIPAPGLPDDTAKTRRVALLSGPIHYDILLPLTPDIRADFDFAADAGVPVRDLYSQWLIVGWGAEQFYTATGGPRRLTPATLWRAVTGDAAVMHLATGGEIIDPTGIHFLDLTEAQYAALVTRILRSFKFDAKGDPIPLDYAGFTPDDRFFAATGRFDILRTCNVWIGDTLRAAGLPFGRWTPLPQSIRLSVWQNRLAAP